eukprot:scaffold302_cov397-Prasinococcus_capsulatus_cf.AAC.5
MIGAHLHERKALPSSTYNRPTQLLELATAGRWALLGNSGYVVGDRAGQYGVLRQHEREASEAVRCWQRRRVAAALWHSPPVLSKVVTPGLR